MTDSDQWTGARDPIGILRIIAASTGYPQKISLVELEAFLKPRLAASKQGEFSDKSVDDIFDEVEKE